MSYEVTVYPTPYVENPTRTTVIGTLDDARQVAEGFAVRSYEVYVKEKPSDKVVAALINGEKL